MDWFSPGQPGPEAAGAIGGAIGSGVGGYVWLIYPVVPLFFILRPTVVAVFHLPPPPKA